MADQQYYQNDPRWENSALGNNPSATIRIFGCLLTSLTMVANHFGGKYTPASYNDAMKANGGFGPGSQWIKTFAISNVMPNVRYQKGVECPNQPAPLALIDQGLQDGSLIIIKVDRDKNDKEFEEMDGHWVVIHAKQGADYLIWDPWKDDAQPDTLTGRYGFGYKKPDEIIQQVIWFGEGEFPTTAVAPPAPAKTPKPKMAKTTPQAPAPTTPPSSDAPLAVKPTVEQLSVRQQPQITASNIVTYVNEDAALQVLEAAQGARAKIGKQNQWLHIRTSDGKEGYVAAWFVQETAVSTPSPTPKSAPAAATAKTAVKTTADLVSLRKEPRVANETFIRSLANGEALEVLDGATEAAKIGQQNQWLHVQAKDGTQGYVAAWLVTRA
ncbi:MAG: SH3 domain-containing protein [Ardenticatenaceae bacterium]|nr:SH3 domain-containing protein [Anaerolineales bacterium]MCB8923571.1 SH3 domain-containing protein [Ardenticatenaceae bacterium]MCB8991720.1 SH3 domain-containing protein [Ardenticatenaceae bacterium]